MTLSDTIRRAALGGPKPACAFGVKSWLGYENDDAGDAVLKCLKPRDGKDEDYWGWREAPEEVQRMFLCFVAESCE